MIELRQILCPVDFSDASRRALAHAAALAGWYQARLHVVHVALPLPPLSSDMSGDDGLAQTARQSLQVSLEAFVAPIRAAGLGVETSLREGYVVSSILDDATTIDADLMVVGTHGYGGFDRFVLGSVTEKLLRKSSCPVLVVPAETTVPAEAAVGFKVILCPVDFSGTTESAVWIALSLAQESGGKILLVHVLDRPDDRDWPDTYRNALDAAQADRSTAAAARLQTLIPESSRDWCEPSVVVATGRPSDGILDLAEERGASLIVMGTHGGNFLTRALVGSTTNAVIRRAACPVLTVVPGQPIAGA